MVTENYIQIVLALDHVYHGRQPHRQREEVESTSRLGVPPIRQRHRVPMLWVSKPD